jgi:hypothetical protein
MKQSSTEVRGVKSERKGRGVEGAAAKKAGELMWAAAVREYPMELKRVPKEFKTERVCLAAVTMDGMALGWVEEQTEAVCLEAVKCWLVAVRWIRDDGMVERVVGEYPGALRFVKNQTEAVCLAGVRKDACAVLEIRDEEMRERVARKVGMDEVGF